jgi:hypothetical protein
MTEKSMCLAGCCYPLTTTRAVIASREEALYSATLCYPPYQAQPQSDRTPENQTHSIRDIRVRFCRSMYMLMFLWRLANYSVSR